jgi:hypothetical protein
MIRATKIGSVVVGLAASGLAWGQSALTPPAPVVEPAGKIITVNEPGKPVQKCRLIKLWVNPGGGKACQVQAIDTGHIMTIVQSGPTSPGADGKTLPMTIYHWSGNTPHPEAPMPPITVETTSAVRTGATTLVQHSEPMPTGAPVVTTTPRVSSAFMQPPPPPPENAPRPMTPGGVVLTPAPAGHDCRDCGAGCTTCKPSLMERIKSCFRRDCNTGCCPDGCTACTTDSGTPAKTSAGETIVPAPAPAPKSTPTKTTSLFHRQRLGGEDFKDDVPHADAKKSDPLKDPAAYSPSKSTAELAITTAPALDQPNVAGPVGMNGKTPLGAGSVLQAGDPRYVPVPIVTMPDTRRQPMPPAAQIPQAPQPNQSYTANAFTNGTMPTPPPVAMGEMTGNAFGPNAYAATMAEGAFHEGMPNARGYTNPGFAPPGYGGMGYGQPLPTMPVGAAVQPGFYGPPRGQMVAPASYYIQPYAPSPAPLMQPAAPAVDVQSLLNQMHDSMLPSQREWAAIQLSELDWRTQPQVVDWLVQSAKDDPAASVRAGCVHGLAKMNVNTPPVIAAINSLRSDPDVRVQREASDALAKLAPNQAPAMMTDPAVQPAGAILPPPPQSN